MSTPNHPSPLLIFDALNGFQRATSLKAAIELEVFTHIAAGANQAAEIAQRAQTSEKGMRILCDFLTINGFLTKEGGAYGLTPDSAFFLDRKSPAYFGSVALRLVVGMAAVLTYLYNGGAHAGRATYTFLGAFFILYFLFAN